MTTTEYSRNSLERESQAEPERKERRLRSSRWVLTRMFIFVAVLAVLIVGLVNFLGARSIFTGTIEAQLASFGSDRAETVASALDRVRAEVKTLASDLSIAQATSDFTEAFIELDGPSGALEPEQEQALDEFYMSAFDSTADSDVSASLTADALVPLGVPGQYVQFHYIVENPFEPDQRVDLVDAEDGSAYSAAHSRYHPMLVERTRSMGAADLMLIGIGTDDSIVYSAEKRIDFGTSLLLGPYRGTALGAAITDELSGVPVGEAILVDFEAYLPDSGQPTMFAAAAIRDQTQVVGAVVVAVPRDLLDNVMTLDAGWSDAGMGDDAEAYLVGSDRLMRTISRTWVEDPERYLKSIGALGYSPEVAERIVAFDTTVLAQLVDTEAVAVGLGGGTFLGDDTNYLDVKTFAFAEQLRMPGLDWVIVVEMSISQSRASLLDYLWSLLILALITIPITALAAYFMARGLVRPVGPLTDAAESIAAGNVDTQVPDLGRNEYGDLGNRINRISAEIRARDDEREEEDRAITQVLLAALPSRLVEKARAAIENGTIAAKSDFGDLLDTCTVIAVSVSGYFDLTASDMESTVNVSSAFARSVEKLAEKTGVERVRSTPDEYLFTAGLDSPEFATQAAVQFVDGLRDLLDELQSETNRTGEYRIGLSAGRVATGVLRGSELTFGIWGPPVRRALSLAAAAEPYQALTDRTVSDDLGGGWALEPVQLTDLQDDQIQAFVIPRSSED